MQSMGTIKELQNAVYAKMDEIHQRDVIISELESELEEKEDIIKHLSSQLDKYRSVLQPVIRMRSAGSIGPLSPSDITRVGSSLDFQLNNITNCSTTIPLEKEARLQSACPCINIERPSPSTSSCSSKGSEQDAIGNNLIDIEKTIDDGEFCSSPVELSLIQEIGSPTITNSNTNTFCATALRSNPHARRNSKSIQDFVEEKSESKTENGRSKSVVSFKESERQRFTSELKDDIVPFDMVKRHSAFSRFKNMSRTSKRKNNSKASLVCCDIQGHFIPNSNSPSCRSSRCFDKASKGISDLSCDHWEEYVKSQTCKYQDFQNTDDMMINDCRHQERSERSFKRKKKMLGWFRRKKSTRNKTRYSSAIASAIIPLESSIPGAAIDNACMWKKSTISSHYTRQSKSSWRSRIMQVSKKSRIKYNLNNNGCDSPNYVQHKCPSEYCKNCTEISAKKNITVNVAVQTSPVRYSNRSSMASKDTLRYKRRSYFDNPYFGQELQDCSVAGTQKNLVADIKVLEESLKTIPNGHLPRIMTMSSNNIKPKNQMDSSSYSDSLFDTNTSECNNRTTGNDSKTEARFSNNQANCDSEGGGSLMSTDETTSIDSKVLGQKLGRIEENKMKKATFNRSQDRERVPVVPSQQRCKRQAISGEPITEMSPTIVHTPKPVE